MRTPTLSITIPEGYEIDTLDKKTGEIKLKAVPKNIMERIKTIEDVIAHHGLSKDEFYATHSDLTLDEIAYILLKMLAQALNEGWTPDWSNSNEVKYYAWFEMRGSSGFRFYGYVNRHTDSHVGSRLCFKSRELAEYAGKSFTALYKQFMVIE